MRTFGLPINEHAPSCQLRSFSASSFSSHLASLRRLQHINLSRFSPVACLVSRSRYSTEQDHRDVGKREQLSRDDRVLGEIYMRHPSRYHPVLVALHWALALLVIAALALGTLIMAKMPNSDPMKIEALRSHLAGGVLIL